MKNRISKRLVPLLIFFAIIVGSVFQGIFSQDYHHYGLMLSNALDLTAGKLPYKDIFIQYGFLTTLIHSLTYLIFKSMIGLTFITAIFYAYGLLILKKIYSQCIPNNKFGLYFLLVCYLFHPVIFLPWSNYIAFPFLLLSISSLISKDADKSLTKNIQCGIFFGLAILAREGNILAIALLIALFIMADFFCFKKTFKNILIRYSKILFGIAITLTPFFLYLHENQLFFYWKTHSIDLPKVYADVVFPNMNLYKFYLRFIKESVMGMINFDIRWFLINSIVLVNVIYLLKIMFNRNNLLERECAAKISIASLALLVLMLHIPEIFRFASGGILGLILVFCIFENKKWGHLAILFIIGGLTATFVSGTSGVNISYRFFQNQNKLKVVSVEGFQGLIWPENSILAYERISTDLKKLQSNPCNFKYHFNVTDNNFLTFLSPFNKFQIAPHHFSSANYTSDKFDALRPDLNYKEKIIEADDIVIFDYVDKNRKYNNFIVFNSYEIYDSILGIYIPEKCLILN
jgi:hypothetical protein